MALRKSAGWGPIILACALGCATSTQDAGLAPPPGGDQGGTDTAGTGGADPTGSAGTTTQTAGTFGSGGTDATGGTASTAGTFSNAGSFTAAGFSSGGTFGSAGTAAGGASGGMAAGGAAAGAGGKASGGTGGSSAGAGGKASGGTGGGGPAGGKCGSTKLTVATATSSGTPEYAASQAVDGDAKNTRWSSEHMMDDEWLQLDFGQSVTVNHVNIVWETAYATSYEIQISDSATGPFTTLEANTMGMGGTEDLVAPALKKGVGRYLRMQGIARHAALYGYSIWEITAYGDTDPTCQ